MGLSGRAKQAGGAGVAELQAGPASWPAELAGQASGQLNPVG